MKIIPGVILVFSSFVGAQAQQVPRKVVAEHFTNTYCSVCASRNPGYHNNLFRFPEVLHVSYFPSSPYPACPINQENKPEHDSRTTFYGIYGATPRIVIQGKVIPASTDYTDTSLFHDELNKTTSFQVISDLKMAGPSTIELTLKAIKKDTSSVTELNLYAVLAEDTLSFNANNGEKVFYHVFKKSFSGTLAVKVKMPVSVGDTVTEVLSVPVDGAWRLNKLFAVSILQDADKHIIQADRSAYLESATGIPGVQAAQDLLVFPNPANDYLYLQGHTASDHLVSVYDGTGRKLQNQEVRNGRISIAQLAPGVYWLHLHTSGQSVRFIKK